MPFDIFTHPVLLGTSERQIRLPLKFGRSVARQPNSGCQETNADHNFKETIDLEFENSPN